MSWRQKYDIEKLKRQYLLADLGRNLNQVLTDEYAAELEMVISATRTLLVQGDDAVSGKFDKETILGALKEVSSLPTLLRRANPKGLHKNKTERLKATKDLVEDMSDNRWGSIGEAVKIISRASGVSKDTAQRSVYGVLKDNPNIRVKPSKPGRPLPADGVMMMYDPFYDGK